MDKFIQLNTENGFPIYRQLANYLKQQIVQGEYQVGDLLPSETELVQKLDISRTTVRLAFNDLVNSGLVKRERGKGTIVISSGITSQLSHLSSFTEEVARLGMTPGTQLVSSEKVTSPTKVSKRLAIEPNTEVMKVIRLRTADDRPIGLVTTWLNINTFPQLNNLDYSSLSLYEVYEKNLGLTILRATEFVWADDVSDHEKEKLCIQRDDPVLRITRVTYIKTNKEGGTPIEYIEGVFKGKIYIVETELFR